jgi:hypothetical protein
MQHTLDLDTPALDPALVAGLRRHGWRLVRSAMVDGEARYWFSGKEQTPQRDATGASRPLPPLCKTIAGAAAMLSDLEAEHAR